MMRTKLPRIDSTPRQPNRSPSKPEKLAPSRLPVSAPAMMRLIATRRFSTGNRSPVRPIRHRKHAARPKPADHARRQQQFERVGERADDIGDAEDDQTDQDDFRLAEQVGHHAERQLHEGKRNGRSRRECRSRRNVHRQLLADLRHDRIDDARGQARSEVPHRDDGQQVLHGMGWRCHSAERVCAAGLSVRSSAEGWGSRCAQIGPMTNDHAGPAKNVGRKSVLAVNLAAFPSRAGAAAAVRRPCRAEA